MIFSNVDRAAPPLVMHSLRDRTEAGMQQARQHYADMGIALHVVPYEGRIYVDSKGNIGGEVNTSSGQVRLKDFISSQTGKALTMMATPDVPLRGASSGTRIVDGVPQWTVLQGGPKDAEHEMAHSFGNTIGSTQNDFTNAITDFAWFADRTQHDYTSLGWTQWFEQTLREGAAKLDERR